MGEKFNFEKLIVYQKALAFANEIYTNTKNWPKDFAFSITDQLKRASLSIVLNVAEGASRTKNEFKRFIVISRGSCHECIPILEIAYKQSIIDLKRKEAWREEIICLSKMLSKLKGSIS